MKRQVKHQGSNDGHKHLDQLCRSPKPAGDSLVACLIKAPLGNRDVFMKVFHAALLREVCYSVPISTEHPFSGQKPLQTHWASGVYPCSTDTDLSSCNNIKQNIVKVNLHRFLIAHPRKQHPTPHLPKPKRYPSAKRLLEFQNTQALSTCCRNCSAVSSFSVTMTSVWALPYLWMWSTASCMLSTTSMQHSRSPYSVRRDFTSEGLKVKYDANCGPAWILTWGVKVSSRIIKQRK